MTATIAGDYAFEFESSSQLFRGLRSEVDLSKFSRLEAAPSTALVLFDLKAEKETGHRREKGPLILLLISLSLSNQIPQSLNTSLHCCNKPLYYLVCGPLLFLPASLLIG